MTLQDHVHGGHARWASPTGWRARYGSVPTIQRVALVQEARARLARSGGSSTSVDGRDRQASAAVDGPPLGAR